MNKLLHFNSSRFLFLLCSLCGLVGFSASLWAAEAGNSYLGRWTLELMSSHYDEGSDTTQFVYELSGENFTPGDSQTGKDLSHWVMPLPSGASVIAASVDEITSPETEVGTDPTTDVYGLKYDDGQPIGTTYTYSFSVTGSWATTNGFFYVKAGSGDYSVVMASVGVPVESGGDSVTGIDPGELVNTSACPIISDTMGDETFEWISRGSAAVEYLPDVLANNTPAILSPDGVPIETGAVDFSISGGSIIADPGETPVGSEQLHFQRFFATESVTLSITYSGFGFAGYHSTFGVYSYHKSNSQRSNMHSDNNITYKPLFIQNETTEGTSVSFDIEADHYFGFYLIANSNPNTGSYYTENRFNSDVGSVLGNDEQRPEGVTDHFIFYDTDQGIVIALEDLSLRSNYKLGDQDYEDMIVTFFHCEGGLLIDTENNVVDTGVPSGGGGAGLESKGGLAEGYAMRTYLGNRDFSSAPTPHTLVAESGVVTAKNSPLRHLPVFSKQPYELAAEPSKLDLAALVPKDLVGGGAGTVVTPADIPFVSNAEQVLAYDYTLSGQVIGSVFATLTQGQPYSHSKGVCDRSGGGILEEITSTFISGHEVYLAKTKKAKSNETEWAGLLSISVGSDQTQGIVESFWLPKEFSEKNGLRTFINLQVWSLNVDQTSEIMSDILLHLSSSLSLERSQVPLKPAEVFIKSLRQEGDAVSFWLQNQTGKEIEVHISQSEAHTYRGSEEITDKQVDHLLPPGDSYFTLENDSPLWDALYYVTRSTGGSLKDSAYLTQGSWSYFDDSYEGGRSSGEAQFQSCSKGEASKNRLTLPGCIQFSGLTHKSQGVFRTLNNLSLAPWDSLVLDMSTNVALDFCLETHEKQRFCRTVEPQEMSEVVVDFHELFGEKLVGNIDGVNALSLTHQGPGNLVLSVRSISFARLQRVWQLVQLEESQLGRLENLFPESHDDVIILAYEKGQFVAWANSDEGKIMIQSAGLQGADMSSLSGAVFVGGYRGVFFDRPKQPIGQVLVEGWQLYGHSGRPQSASAWTFEHPEMIIKVVWQFDGTSWQVFEGMDLGSLTFNPGSAYWVYALER